LVNRDALEGLLPGERKRQEVKITSYAAYFFLIPWQAIFELIATEAAYVRDLQIIVGVSGFTTSRPHADNPYKLFYERLVPVLEPKAVTVIFANVEDILLTNTVRQRNTRINQTWINKSLDIPELTGAASARVQTLY
jgi:actin cytoskeleton-regulatory complex protein PAN1